MSNKRLHVKFVNGTSDFIDCDEYSTGDVDYIIAWRDQLPTFINKNQVLSCSVYLVENNIAVKKRLTPADRSISGDWENVP